MRDVIRYIAIVETVTVVLAGGWLFGSLLIVRQDAYVRWFGVLSGYVITLVAVAIFVNVLSPFPPTPGVRVYAIFIAPAVAGFVALAWLSRNRRT